MLVPGILGPVVTQSIERLDKHHHGRNAKARNLSGIVQWPGWESLTGAYGFEDCLVAERDEFGVKRNRLDGPDLRPVDGAVLFCGEALASGTGFTQHAGEN